MAGIGAEYPGLVATRRRHLLVRLRHDVLAMGDPASVSFGRAKRIVHGTISERKRRDATGSLKDRAHRRSRRGASAARLPDPRIYRLATALTITIVVK